MNSHNEKPKVRFLVGFMTVLDLCRGGIHLLHRVQMGRNASSLLDRARSAEAGGNLLRAEESLSLYLGLKREDSSAWTWYARLTDERTKEKRGRERVFLVNEEALRKNPDDRKLERRCAELAIELERHNISYQGLAMPCCMVATPDRIQLGSMAERGAPAIWNGPDCQAFRDQLSSDHPPEVCRSCSIYSGTF